MKKILLNISLFLILIIIFTIYKINVIKKKQAKSALTISSIWQEQGKPVDVLNIKKTNFINYFKITAIKINEFELECEVPFSIKNKLKINNKFISSSNITGSIISISNTPSFENSLYSVRLKSNTAINSNFIQIYIEESIIKNSIQLPRSIVDEIDNNYFVWVVDDNRVKQNKIKFNTTNAFNQILISDGLKVGDKVVILGKEILKEYDLVKVGKDYND